VVNNGDDNQEEACNWKLVEISKIEMLLNKNNQASIPSSNAPGGCWTRSTQYPMSNPIGVLPNGEFPILDLPSSLDRFEHARFLVPATAQDATDTTRTVPQETRVIATNIESNTIQTNNNPKPQEIEERDSDILDPHQTTDTVNNLFLMYNELFV